MSARSIDVGVVAARVEGDRRVFGGRDGVGIGYRRVIDEMAETGAKTEVEAGEKVAIIGENGVGKTTLLKILRGLYPATDGRVLLDGADIHQFTQAELGQRIGYLSQTNQLLSTTIRDNICLANPDATDEQIIKAAERACAHSFVIDLPDGYATHVGEGAQRFSGGQTKRIAIAQALLNDPPVLLLDEPTAELDRDSEARFVSTLKELAKERTVIVVTHSPYLLSRCNGILVMNKGKLVAAGPADELLPKLGMNIAS